MRSLLFFTVVLIFAFAKGNSVKAQTSVKTHEGVNIGGIQQWIGAKGDDASKPVLLFLHGGPGFSSKTYTKKLVRALRRDFIVVQWDQRETSITKAWNRSKDSLSLPLMYQDTEAVIRYVLQKFDKDKLYLLGYSWGGHLGFQAAAAHPELLHALIAVNPMVAVDKGNQLTLSYLKERALQTQNTKAIAALDTIRLPISSWQSLKTLREWINYFESGRKSSYSESIYSTWAAIWMPLYLEASRFDSLNTYPVLDCPVYFLSSTSDYVSHFKTVEAYYNQLEAPKKEMIWFSEAGHDIPSKKPKELAKTLLDILREGA
ncbi:MAG: hypothetical protein CL867_06250 [Cytophagaceae bacterium]|nr:hypothetical protein [Cytophagaceae bacterium]